MKKEKILDVHYEPKMHWKSVNRQNVLNAMEFYANNKPKEMGDLQGCEACERFADIELMHAHGDVYICSICKESIATQV